MDEWAIQVLGDPEAISRLDSGLGVSDNIREDDGNYFLVHSAWQGMTEWTDVEAAGRAFLTQANGLLRVRGPVFEPLRFGGVARFKAAGGRDYFASATVAIRMTGSAVGEHLGADGKPVPPPPDPLTAWLPKVEADITIQRAVHIFAGANDWIDLYKVYELARDGLGGQKVVEARISVATRSKFTQTANHHRHTNVPLPTDPMTFDEAERLIARLLEELLK